MSSDKYFEVELQFIESDSVVAAERFTNNKEIYCDYHNCDEQEKEELNE